MEDTFEGLKDFKLTATCGERFWLGQVLMPQVSGGRESFWGLGLGRLKFYRAEDALGLVPQRWAQL